MRAVAMRAGVSVATVSRVINYVPSVNSALSVRVWNAVEELEYFINTQARTLVLGKSKLFGLIVSATTNPFFPELVQEFEQAAFSHGYEILISSTNYESKSMELCARRMLQRKVEGVAIMTFGVEEFAVARFVAAEIPIIFVNAPKGQPYGDALAVDYRAGVFEGVQHLATIGHRRIGFISGPLRLHSAELRKAAFLDSMRQIGIAVNPAWLVEGNHTLASGRDAMKRILTLPELPTAIMCSNDLTAIGVQHALFRAGFNVPDDFSLIGFDDVQIAEHTIPPLTTIRMSCRELARAAVDTLVFRASSPECSHELRAQANIGTRLIVRRTTAHPRTPGLFIPEAFRHESASGSPIKSA